MARNVLITGASGGIGSAVARAFAKEGASVILGYNKNSQGANALCDELLKKGYSAVTVQADIAIEDDVSHMFAFAEKTFGAIDVLVNNAGFAQQKMFLDITTKEWEDMFAVHVRGTFLCSRHALPNMVQKKSGVIINIASMWGQVGASCEVHYSAAKAAVIGFTKALAKEVGPSGIRVNCVAPGVIETDMMKEFDEHAKAVLCEETPLRRSGTAYEIASAVVFLASESASFITGQVLASNGGMVI